MVSALEHYSYCPRQCALIHLEHVWDENVYTMRGRDTHERVDEATSRAEAGVRVERALPIWSKRLNLTGRADVVEFHGDAPYPVEYKSGKHRKGRHETFNSAPKLSALKRCWNVKIDKGALYWHGSRERKEIILTRCPEVASPRGCRGGSQYDRGDRIPPPVNDKRCEDCSLREACLPHVAGNTSKNRKAAKELFECRDRG